MNYPLTRQGKIGVDTAFLPIFIIENKMNGEVCG